VKRRTFITGLGSAAAWPVVARAQQVERMRRVGVLLAVDSPGRLDTFRKALEALGWFEGRNLRMDVRFAGDGAPTLDRMRISAKELVGLQPDVILADTTPVTAAVQRETRTIPIVFTTVSDPIGSGFVSSLPHPGGNITGVTNDDSSMVGKWLELLTQIAPGVKRVAMMFNPDMAPYVRSYYQSSFEAGARSIKVEPIIAPVLSDSEIETVITSLGREPGGGLIVMPDAFLFTRRALISSLAARNNVPTVARDSDNVRDGGLISYGVNLVDIFRRAAPYVDQILRGAKPSDIPVQLPVKFELAVNIKTAKALGLTVPQSILLSADEVIE
jgi:putative ABC transport system substrate-binding protein